MWTVAFGFIFIFGCGTHFCANWTTLAPLVKYCSTGLPQEEVCYLSEFIINGLLIIAPSHSVWNSLTTYIKDQIDLESSYENNQKASSNGHSPFGIPVRTLGVIL